MASSFFLATESRRGVGAGSQPRRRTIGRLLADEVEQELLQHGIGEERGEREEEEYRLDRQVDSGPVKQPP